MADAIAEANQLFLPEQLARLDKSRIPKHIGLVMDGNRRWAKSQGLPPLVGHWRGTETLSNIIKASIQMGIKHVTAYAFSTENWNRSALEIQSLMRLFKTYLKLKRNAMLQEGVRLSTIGDLTRLPTDLRGMLQDTVALTANCQVIELVLAINYGGRDELCRAIRGIIGDCLKAQLSLEAINEELVSSYLDTAERPDPELIIRTSGEHKLSNFLLWQSSYSQMVVTPILWPDFSHLDFLEAILEYQSRESRYGK